MEKKKLENLNLVDDFLFGSLVSHPEFGEPFVKEILKTIFGRIFGRLTVVPQKVYYRTDTDMHGARLDVYLEEDAEDPSLPYEDGAQTIFLYTRGTEGNSPEGLRELLRYMEHSIRENVTNENLKQIDQMVNLVKQDKEVSWNYMKIFEREAMLVQQGVEQGIEQGKLLEQKNTERERLRAEKAEQELQMLREKLLKMENKA